MFDYTRAVLNDIIEDLKKLVFRLKVVATILPILYLAVALALQTGILIANILLLATAIANLVFFICTEVKERKEKRKLAVKKTVKTVYIWFKRIVKLAIIVVTGCELILSKEYDVIALALFIFTVFGWTLEILFAYIIKIIEGKTKLVSAGWKADVEPVIKLVNPLRKMRGDEPIDVDISEKDQAILDELAEQYHLKKREKKETLKVERAERRKQYRAEFMEKIKAKFRRTSSENDVQRIPAPGEDELAREIANALLDENNEETEEISTPNDSINETPQPLEEIAVSKPKKKLFPWKK